MTFFFISLFMLLVFWRPQEWLVPFLYGLPILDAVFYLSLLTLFLEIREGRIRFPRGAPQILLLAGLFFAALMSHIAHTYFQGMLDTIIPSLKFCVFTLVLFIALDRPARLLFVARMFVFMACFMAVHALLQQARGYGFAFHRPFFVGTHHRSTFFGIFEDPNDLSQMLAASIPFAFVVTRRRSSLSVLLGIGITVLLVYGVLATGSRGGLVGLAAAGAMMVATVLPSRWLPYYMALLVTGFLVACPLAGGLLDESAHDRVVFWGTANWYFKTNPLFGVGSGMMIEYMPKGRAIHSAYVSCYTEMGVFGYWFWFGLLQVGILGSWRARVAFRDPNTYDQLWLKRFAGMAIAAMVSFAAAGYFLSRAFVYPLFFLFALLGAVPVVANRMTDGEPIPVALRGKDYALLTAGSLASIAYVYLSILLLNRVWYG